MCYLRKVVVLFFIFVFSSKETTTQDLQIAPQTMRRYLTSLIIRKMKIKLTVRYNITYVRMTTNRDIKNMCWWVCGEKGNLDYKLLQPLWKTIWMFPKWFKNRTIVESIVPFLDIYLEKWSYISTQTCSNVRNSLIQNNQKLGKSPMSTDKRKVKQIAV